MVRVREEERGRGSDRERKIVRKRLHGGVFFGACCQENVLLPGHPLGEGRGGGGPLGDGS